MRGVPDVYAMFGCSFLKVMKAIFVGCDASDEDAAQECASQGASQDVHLQFIPSCALCSSQSASQTVPQSVSQKASQGVLQMHI